MCTLGKVQYCTKLLVRLAPPFKFCFSLFLFSTGTGDTATALTDRASNENLLEKYFVTKGKEGREGAANKRYADRVKKSRSRELGIHFENGIGIHHVGLIVAVDLLMEKHWLSLILFFTS